jgi:hypothetical protein
VNLHNPVLFCLLTAWLIFTCGRAPTAGGSSDSGNVKFAGVILTDSRIPAAAVSVTLCPAGYLKTDPDAAEDEAGRPVRKTITDSAGMFSFLNIDSGDYVMEANDGISAAVARRITISLDGDEPPSSIDTLRPYAGIRGTVGSPTPSTDRRSLLVYGLDRRDPIDSNGQFYCRGMPAGTFRFRIHSRDTAYVPVDIDGITLTAGVTASFPYFGWHHQIHIALNTTASGADIAENVVNFPVLIRLNEANFDFTQAALRGTDIRFSGRNNTPLPCEIERWDPENRRAEIWVKMDTIFGNSSTQFITMYWGSPEGVPVTANRTVFDTANGFRMVWHLSDDEVNPVADATGNRITGTPSGMTSASIVDGIIGKARAFDGVSSFIGIAGSADGKLDFREGGPYTLSVWVYAETLDNDSRAIISKGDEQYFLYGIANLADGPLWKFVEFKDQTGWKATSSAASEKQWILLTGVISGTTHLLYVNGTLADSSTELVASTRKATSVCNVAIGAFLEEDGITSEGFFKGYIDEIRISSTPASADWVRLCYMNQRTDDRLLTFTTD